MSPKLGIAWGSQNVPKAGNTVGVSKLGTA